MNINKILKLVVCTVVFLCISVLTYAQSVSFQIIQHDSATTDVRETTYVMENAIFDSLFSSGFIATNSVTAAVNNDEKDKQIKYKALGEASDGGCNYFIAIFVDYKDNLTSNTAYALLSNIRKISWEVYDVKSEAVISSGEKEIVKVTSSSDNERGVASYTRIFSAEIIKSLK